MAQSRIDLKCQILKRQFSRANPICAIAVGMLLLGAAEVPIIDRPFARATVVAPEGQLWAEWQRAQSEMKSDEKVIGQCRAEPTICASPQALRFLSIVNEAQQYQGLTLLGHINRAFNLAIQPGHALADSGDQKWKSPLTALASKDNNCTSYAIAKYLALSDVGIAENEMRLIIVAIRPLEKEHMVVAVLNLGNWIILDDRSMALVDSRKIDDYLPLFALDYRGVRQFAPPNPKVAIAPACVRTVG